MIFAVSAWLRVAGLIGGVAVGLGAVALARTIPPGMGLEHRPRPAGWWAIAVAVGIGYGWGAASASGAWVLLPGYLGFGITTLAVTLTDIDHQLIPNRILYPGFVASGSLLAVGAIAEGQGHALAVAGGAAITYFVFLLIVALIAPDGFGMGDVKLALLLGLFLGYDGWDVLVVGFSVGILLGGAAAVLLLIFTRRGRKAKFAYGPSMVAGAWIGLFWGAQIADWYLRNGG